MSKKFCERCRSNSILAASLSDGRTVHNPADLPVAVAAVITYECGEGPWTDPPWWLCQECATMVRETYNPDTIAEWIYPTPKGWDYAPTDCP